MKLLLKKKERRQFSPDPVYDSDDNIIFVPIGPKVQADQDGDRIIEAVNNYDKVVGYLLEAFDVLEGHMLDDYPELIEAKQFLKDK